MALARTKEDLSPLLQKKDWQIVDPAPSITVWTDDYTNLLSTLEFLHAKTDRH